MNPAAVKLDAIYVPAKFRATLDPKKVEAIAESIIEEGLRTPDPGAPGQEPLRAGDRLPSPGGGDTFLGETTIQALIVRAAQH